MQYVYLDGFQLFSVNFFSFECLDNVKYRFTPRILDTVDTYMMTLAIRTLIDYQIFVFYSIYFLLDMGTFHTSYLNILYDYSIYSLLDMRTIHTSYMNILYDDSWIYICIIYIVYTNMFLQLRCDLVNTKNVEIFVLIIPNSY